MELTVQVLEALCLEIFCQGSGVSFYTKESHILPHTHTQKITPLFRAQVVIRKEKVGVHLSCAFLWLQR